MTQSRVAGGFATAWSVVRLFVVRVFVEPVREGRLRDIAWPSGLRAIVAVGIASYVVAVALVLFSGLLRESFELATQTGAGSATVPRGVVWLVMALTAVAVSLGQSGALHGRAWLRWVVTTFTVLVLLLASTPDLSPVPVGRIVAITASLGLILFVALRGHRRFAWWDFVVIFGVIAGSFAASIAAVASASLPLGFDFGPVVVSLVLLTVGQLAVPAAIAAGASVAELAVTSATWAVGAVRDRLGRVALVVLLCLVLVWRIVDMVPAVALIVTDPLPEIAPLVSALVFLVVVGGLWMLVARVRRGGDAPTTAGLVSALSATALLIAAFLTLTIPSSIAQLGGLVVVAYSGSNPLLGSALLAVSELIGSFAFINLVRATTGAVLIVIALVLARRGRTVVPELFMAVGVANLLTGINVAFGLSLGWTSISLSVIATIAVVGMLVWLLVRRALTPTRLVAISAALLMAALFAHRDFLSDPLAAVLGSAVAATVLLGFVWALLTGYGAANKDSPRYPRPARVQLVLANALFGATVLAYGVLARDPDSVINLGQFTDLGGRSFGDALIAGSLLVALTSAARDRPLE